MILICNIVWYESGTIRECIWRYYACGGERL